jgi:3-keto-L-gulonate-6-phosphate decarboxylase
MVAGGISVATIPSILPIAPEILVVGGSIANSTDPGSAARDIRAAMQLGGSVSH